MSAGLDGVMQLSHINDGVEPAWGKSVSLAWKSDSFRVQGWLMLPRDYDPAKKYPLIVEVHGGPAAAVESHWSAGGLSPAAFSALGYFVLLPNPRGSFGQGEAFTQANRKDFGYGDLRDILAGVDAVEAKYPVDPNRVGITGWSYGGFMTMFAVTQTQRFKAAVAGRGNLRLAQLLRRKLHRPVDDSLLWRLGLRRSGGLRQELGDQLHQAGAHAHAGGGGRPGRRVPGAPVVLSSGMRCATSMCPRNWWCIPTRATALSIRRTGAT